MRSARRLLAALVLISPLALWGCSQGVGDRCQVDSDCQDGLRCILAPTATPQTGGTCQMPGSLVADMSLPSAPVDQSTTD
jgi:hypothetical protein